MKTLLHRRSRPSRTAWLVSLSLLVGCPSGSDDPDGHGRAGEGTRSEGGEPRREGRVELTEKQLRSAGVEVAPARPGRVSEALTLPGTVAPNADAVLHVTPRVSGQVRSVSKHLGEEVQAGETLCVIDSVQLGDAVAGFIRERELARAAEETLARERELYAERLTALATVLDGAIEIQQRIYEREEELAQKAVSTVRPLLEADKALQLARLERDKQVTELRAARDARLFELDVEVRTKRIDLAAAANQLRAMGLGGEEIEGLDASSPLLSGEYRVRAMGPGVVVDRHVSTGEFVEAGAKLYIIENLASVWFVASAFEQQLRSVRSGQPAHVALDAFPGTALQGVVSFVDYHVDPTSRSVGVRISLDNRQLESWPEELPLRPGMFGRAELETTSREAALVLPEAALVHEDAGDYVFVQVEPLAFERRDVAVRPVAGGRVEVLSGLREGEAVAVSGTFLLKSAERQGELGGGHGH